MTDIITIDGIKYVRTDGGALLKHSDHLTDAERAERYGDASYDRDANTRERDAAIVEMYLAGRRLSISDSRRARKLIRGLV